MYCVYNSAPDHSIERILTEEITSLQKSLTAVDIDKGKLAKELTLILELKKQKQGRSENIGRKEERELEKVII